MSDTLSWEQAVKRLRTMPEQAALVRDAYLDEDNLAAAQRFAMSAEFKEVLLVLARYLDKDQPWDVIDVGAGNGIAAYAFAEAGHNVFAVEPDPSEDVGAGAIKRLIELDGAGITLLDGCGEKLSIPDQYFDVVYVRQALHHTSDLRQALKESHRILRKGGCLLATREHVIDDEKQLHEFLNSHPLHKWYGGENAFKLDQYIGAIKDAGFKLKLAIKPFDSVINHFPMSTEQLDKERIRFMQRRLGKYLGKSVGSTVRCKDWYAWRRARKNKAPGRLYSFVAKKTV